MVLILTNSRVCAIFIVIFLSNSVNVCFSALTLYPNLIVKILTLS